VGFACYLLGRYDDALVYWRQGLDLAKKSGDPSGVVLATENLGLLSVARGEWDDAVKSFLAVLHNSRELDMKEATATALGQLGRLAQYQGRPAAALASFTEALGVLRQLDDRRGLAEFTLAQAEVQIELGAAEAAGERLQSAAELLREGKNREHQAELERLQGEWHRLRGERDAAREALHRAVADAQDSHSVVELLEVRLSAAEADLDAGRTRPALAELERLRAQAEALGHARLRLHAAEALTRAALAAGDLEKARTVARAGLDEAAACGGYARAYRLHQLLALAFERSGKQAEAGAERGRAAEEIARVSRDLAPAQRQSFDRIVEVKDVAEPTRSGQKAGGDGGGPGRHNAG